MSMTPDEYERWYDQTQQARKRESNAPAWIGLAVVICVGLLIGAAVLVDIFPKVSGDTPADKPQIGNVGGQAPASIRGTNSNAMAVATPLPGIAQNEATAQAKFDADVSAGNQPGNTSVIHDPLPLNSAGAPIIDARQQQQLNFSAEMAAQEAQASVGNARATDVASRPPDVPKADADALLHRDLCHVPHADPHTCEQGLYKPTPVN